LKAEIAARQIDVLIVDPFVSSHRVSENDNNAIDAVAREWANIADAAQCAIELVHHSRKTGGGEVTIEDARGASALIAASRSARVINPMSPDEAAKAGVENPRAYFRRDNGKSSMSPPGDKATWFCLVSVDLGNASEDEPGDHVGVVESWTWPNPLDQVSVADLRAVQAAVSAGRWRDNAQAKDWVGHAVAQALKLDASNKQHRAKIIGLLKIWKSTGMLVEVEGKDAKRETRTFVEVGTPAND
ncbi:MAG: AAA family ATPase, partial [Roseiarcus sp.]